MIFIFMWIMFLIVKINLCSNMLQKYPSYFWMYSWRKNNEKTLIFAFTDFPRVFKGFLTGYSVCWIEYAYVTHIKMCYYNTAIEYSKYSDERFVCTCSLISESPNISVFGLI